MYSIAAPTQPARSSAVVALESFLTEQAIALFAGLVPTSILTAVLLIVAVRLAERVAGHAHRQPGVSFVRQERMARLAANLAARRALVDGHAAGEIDAHSFSLLIERYRVDARTLSTRMGGPYSPEHHTRGISDVGAGAAEPVEGDTVPPPDTLD